MRLTDDLRLGLRSLRNRPAFTITAALTLALGIGLSTAAYTVADALLLRRLPIRDQDRVVVLWGKKPAEEFAYPLGMRDVAELKRRARGFDHLASYGYEGAQPVLIRDGDQVSRLKRSLVSGNFFDALGASPILGRALNPARSEERR